MERTLYWQDDCLYLLDQRKLPHTIEYFKCTDYNEAIDAIKTMVVRGAPAIGVSAAYAMALAEIHGEDLNVAADEIKQARPTAVNLFWAVDKVLDAVKNQKTAVQTASEMEKEVPDDPRRHHRPTGALLLQVRLLLPGCTPRLYRYRPPRIQLLRCRK